MSGSYNVALGIGLVTTGFCSMALGGYDTVNGDYASSLGTYLTVNGSGGVGIGYSAGAGYFTVGTSTANQGIGQVAIGVGTMGGEILEINPVLNNVGYGYVADEIVTVATGSYNATVKVLTVLSTGPINWNSLSAGGTGYVVGDTGTVDGGTGGEYYVDSIDGAAASVSVNNGGTGYSVNDVLTLEGGGYDCTVTVTGVTAGVIDSVSLTTAGTGYSATTYGVTGGTGNNDAIISIDSLVGAVTGYSITNTGSGYSTGIATTTATSGAGSGFAIDITSVLDGGIDTFEIVWGGYGYSTGTGQGLTSALAGHDATCEVTSVSSDLGGMKAQGTGSIAIGYDVQALTNPNVICIGKNFSSDVTKSFNVGFDAVDFQVISGQVNINDVLKLNPIADAPSSPVEGMIYADTDHHLYYYDGSTWKQLDN
jgi:hypothetical protein